MPVFSFREEAEAFLHLLAEANGGGGWKARETSNGELVSLLYGPYTSVRKVALDPPSVTDHAVLSLVSTDRKCFVQYLVGEPRAEKIPGERKYIREATGAVSSPDYIVQDFSFERSKITGHPGF